MTAAPAIVQPATRRGRRWLMCALIFLIVTVNYVDRQVIGVLKPLIEKDMGWSEVDYGNITAVFQASYAVGLLMVGRWLDRVGSRFGVAIAIGVWSLAAVFHAGARSVLHFILARAALGLSESAAYPGGVKAIAEWFPRSERALAVGFLNAGGNVGVLLTPVVGLMTAALYGWRAAFVATGALGFLALVAWAALYRAPGEDRRLSETERAHILSDGEDPAGKPMSWKVAIRQPQAWSFITAKFFTDPVFALFLFWLPDFLKKTQGMDPFPKGGSGLFASLGPALVGVYLLADVGSIAGGWLSSHLIKRGWTANAARKTTLLAAALCATPLIFVAHAPNAVVAVLIIGVATAGHQAFSSNIYATVSDMYPRRAVGTIAGMGGAAGSIASIIMAQATGWTLQLTHSYVPVLAYAAFAYLIALAVIHRLVPRLQPAPLPTA